MEDMERESMSGRSINGLPFFPDLVEGTLKQVVYGLIVHIHELSDLFVLQPFDKTVLDDHFLTYRQVVQKLVQLVVILVA